LNRKITKLSIKCKAESFHSLGFLGHLIQFLGDDASYS